MPESKTRAKPAARKKATGTTRKKPIPAESPVEMPWADESDLTTTPYVDMNLPVLGKKVRIRVLDNFEAAGLANLPDLARFGELMVAQQKATDKQLTDKDRRELSKERTRYLTLLCHAVVMVPTADPTEFAACDDCGGEHPQSLWTMAQTRRLDMFDLSLIASITEDEKSLERVRPLSQGPMPSDSSEPADTGESTPQTNSA